MCPDPAVPAPTTETAIDPPARRPGDAIRAAIADRRDYLQVTRGELLADLQRQHDALDASTSDILDIEAQLAELAEVRYAFPAPQFIPDDATVVGERGPEWIVPTGPMTTDRLRAAAAALGFELITTQQHQRMLDVLNRGRAYDDDALLALAAARGLTVIDVEQHRWLQGVASRAGAMAGSREDAWAALHPLFWPESPQCSGFHAALFPRSHANVASILDYLAGGR